MVRYLRIMGGVFCFAAWAVCGEPTKEEFLTKIVIKSLSSWHYSPPKLDDTFSKRVYSLSIKRLDAQKRFLLQSDIDSLSKYQNSLDNELLLANNGFFDVANALVRQRITEAQAMTAAMLEGNIDLNTDDSLAIDSEKQPFAKTKDELKLRWMRLLKYQILTHIQDQKNSKEETEKKETDEGKGKDKTKKQAANQLPKAKDAQASKTSSIADQEKEAKSYVARSTRRLFERMLKEARLEKISAYLNTVSNAYDPHTEYFKPEAKEDFDLSMTGTLEGIGAVLREEDGFIKVVSIVPGSASWRQKELKAEDKILKVAQGAEEPVDIVEASVNDAVRMIRGPKGTEVRLTVQKPSGQIKIIPIIRDVVVVEETYAKSAVMSPNSNKRKFGYINLPAFYHDFNNSRGRNSSSDIREELEKLKVDGVEGIVLDFRNNGGGALDDAVKMAGLFFKTGPVVQIKDQKGQTNMLKDQDPDITYDGPLVIMVNTFSASASEIVAAALQDYGRAVIIGTDTSFGKGTVQSMLDLDAYLPPAFSSLRPMGSLKLTIQKFYRINGGTTQYKGVVPDILIPDSYSNMDVGEKNLEYPLPWDTVPSLAFSKWPKQKWDISDLRKKSQTRLKSDAFARQLGEVIEKVQKQRERSFVSVQKSKFFQEQEKARKDSEKFEALQKENVSAIVKAPKKYKVPTDSLELEKNQKWHEQLARDFYLREAINVLADMNPK